jgi:SOS-response transcriptional repressor LexA
MNTSDRITQRMSELGLSAADVARGIGVSPGGVSQWVHGLSAPSGKNLILLSILLKCNPEWILGNYGKSKANASSAALQSVSVKLVPVMTWRIAKIIINNPSSLDPDDAVAWAPCPEDMGEGSFALKVAGDSMVSPYMGERSYSEDTVIFVDPTRKPAIGNRVLAAIPESEEAIFRVYVADSGKFFLKPINPQYGMREVDQDVVVYAVITGSYRSEV